MLRIKNLFDSFRNKSDEDILTYTILFLALIFGVVVRLNFISNTKYPINDGGLFYQMVEDLISNHYKLPEFTSYNFGGIPYAYPPFSFYLAGSIHSLLGIPLFSELKYLPLILNSITILVFFQFSGRFIDNRFLRAVATFFYATLPRSFEWFVMGGGITRSAGLLFAILAINFTWLALDDDKIKRHFLFASIFSALTFLSHPVASLFLVFCIVVMALYKKPTRMILARIFGIAGISLILTSPWWITILSNHGIGPYLGAGNTGYGFEIKNLITLNFGFENPYFLSVIGIFAILGLFNSDNKKTILLGILIVGGYSVMPRGGVDLITIFVAMLAALGFGEVSKSWNKNQTAADHYPNDKQPIISAKTRILLFFVVLYTLIGAYSYKYIDGKENLHLDDYDVQAMEWIRANTEENAQVLLLPSQEDKRYWWNDFKVEWLPAISKRESVSTVQGYEWVPDLFTERVNRYSALRSCVVIDPTCVMNWERDFNIQVNYVIIDDRTDRPQLVDAYFNKGPFINVYKNREIIIFEKIAK